MECPFCGAEMARGRLYGAADKAVYWLPDGADRDDLGFSLTAKRIEANGGVVVDRTGKVLFFAKSRPASDYCKACGVLLTRLEKREDNP